MIAEHAAMVNGLVMFLLATQGASPSTDRVPAFGDDLRFGYRHIRFPAVQIRPRPFFVLFSLNSRKITYT